ncbi:putative ABC transport system permease protein [Rhizobium leguminosarum]|uniref:ABC transport system permease protein n=1 Tax=Rhizobium leguminosarum TaxID=384 RepID=A0AAE2MMC4_RHILE|nr:MULTISPECIES: ABC transporter permease [Rhizobium]MBB4291780.1 putative ABC transport system permease protein [Rhizobium leguminosarum]MBB4298380.1 putative ABC transport system permease protein [Rhizobium leguminosarum]MBB4309518.1 putative ABC transport system permease protein [Rhizobium leguminosarum]MBB4418955.1 putative ABC transport system permease protein [Rhizobium leguminosarum]MBB4433714.1 putative ABC transport system permease protein [Rhizobium esperanzae]
MRIITPRVSLAFRLALRELRGGIRGFYIFLACIALGTGAIAAVNSVSQSITDTIASQGQELLAGDVRFELNNREATPQELGFLEGLGTVSVSTGLRSMARKPDGSDQALVEVKAVDDAYPLYGKFVAEPDYPLAALLSGQGGTYGAVAAPLLLDRLGLAVGDELLLGNVKLSITGTVKTEPDALSEGFGFAPRLLVSRRALEASGLIQTGSLVEHAYKIRLENKAAMSGIQARAAKEFPSAGWAIRTSDRAAPSLTENITRFSQFLTLVGLTALIVGGVGVANAVRAFLDAKRTTIATFKCLGAPAQVVVLIYLFQIAIIALGGILIGLIIGALSPIFAAQFLAQFLPVSTTPTLYPGALLLATLFGILTTLAFAILPLGHAREVPATALFREQGFEARRLPSWPYILLAALFMAALAGLAVLTAYDRFIAVVFVGAIVFAFVVLRLVAAAIAWLARRSPRVNSPALRLAIGNIHRPGALTPSVVLSLGLGLALLVTLTLIDGNLRQQLTGRMNEGAPNFFFVDIQSAEVDAFRDLVQAQAPQGKLVEVPMLRGRIVAFNGEDVTKMDVPAAGRWVLNGDRGITYANTLPENAALTEGSWWDKDYSGEPLVSFSSEEAHELGLKIGDKVTVNVLGRNITAKIANLRRVQWESLSINFVMVFSPNTFRGAPHAWLATLTDPSSTPAEDAAILKSVTNTYPTITSVRVKDAIDIVNQLVAQLATAIRAAASVALIASILVLAGALAAGNRARTHDAVVLKTLGATRAMLIRAFSYEYLILGLATAIFALIAGGVAAWFIVARIMRLPSTFLPDVAGLTLVTALVLTVGIGLIGTWRILGQKAAPVLREL